MPTLRERHVVLDPDGIVLQRSFGAEVVVIVIRILVVAVTRVYTIFAPYRWSVMLCEGFPPALSFIDISIALATAHARRCIGMRAGRHNLKRPIPAILKLHLMSKSALALRLGILSTASTKSALRVTRSLCAAQLTANHARS